ncbi:MAG: hypothetical protein V1886_01155 [archaeon]
MALSKLRRISPLSVAIVVGLINAAVGLFTGLLNFAIYLFLAKNPDIASVLVQSGMQNIAGLSASSAWLILVYPLVGFISGFAATIVFAWLYNLIAKKIQIKLEFK